MTLHDLRMWWEWNDVGMKLIGAAALFAPFFAMIVVIAIFHDPDAVSLQPWEVQMTRETCSIWTAKSMTPLQLKQCEEILR